MDRTKYGIGRLTELGHEEWMFAHSMNRPFTVVPENAMMFEFIHKLPMIRETEYHVRFVLDEKGFVKQFERVSLYEELMKLSKEELDEIFTENLVKSTAALI